MEVNQTNYESMLLEDLKLELCTESDEGNIHMINTLINQKQGSTNYDVKSSFH
jgi:hypothetical protein